MAQSVMLASSGPETASMPVIWPKRVMKVRRVVSPRSKASTSCFETGLKITLLTIVHWFTPPKS